MCDLSYIYTEDGKLTKITLDLRTFHAFDPAKGTRNPTRCVQIFEVQKSGTLKLLSEEMTDTGSGKKVKRSVSIPKIKHWMTVDELPKPEKTDTKD